MEALEMPAKMIQLRVSEASGLIGIQWFVEDF